uniref:Uncharacterized protein n=1 Tax=Romanomermis culicivorax TaxID=13658 RepID=A0A915HJA0_ROMCU
MYELRTFTFYPYVVVLSGGLREGSEFTVDDLWRCELLKEMERVKQNPLSLAEELEEGVAVDEPDEEQPLQIVVEFV